MALSLCEVAVSTLDNISTLFVCRFDDKIGVGPERVKSGTIRRREVGMGEWDRKIKMANVPSTVPNGKIEGR